MFAKLEAVQEAVRQAGAQVNEDPRETVKEARARAMGREATDLMLSPMFCEEAGRAIAIGAKADAQVLWAVFLGCDKAEHTYFARIIGRPRFPNISKLEHMPERLETRDDDNPDTRSDDEKHRDASNTWMRWQGYLGQIPRHQRRAIQRASWHQDELHKGGRLTVHGEAFVAAVRSLADVVERG